jgi:hypothetical protein
MDQFMALTDRLPGNDRIYLSKVELLRPTNTTDDQVGRVVLHGFARERADVLALNQRLMSVSSPYHHVPDEILPSKNEPYYKVAFKSDVLIGPAKAAAVAKTATPAPATKAEPAKTVAVTTPQTAPAPAPAAKPATTPKPAGGK